MKKTKIAILGSNSHIAKGLIHNFLRCGDITLHLYTQSPEKVRKFLESIGKLPDRDCVIHEEYNYLFKKNYDVLINCVGVGTQNKLKGDYSLYFSVTEEYDNMAIRYLTNQCPDALYISFSSGVVYGIGHSSPVEEGSINHLSVNNIKPEDYYSIVRLNAEAKHRAFNKLNIVDLRIFSYFSRFIDLTDGYFITDVMDCILNKRIMVTDSVNMVRDYLHPEDLYSIIIKCMETGKINAAYDVCSSNPVSKFEILDYFSSEYGLKYEVRQSMCNTSATGSKSFYCSKNNSAMKIGYIPEFSSMETVKNDAGYILQGTEVV